MDFKWLKKVGSLILAVTVIFGLQTVVPASAAADEFAIILTDVTQDDPTTLLGEAKVKVSVSGVDGDVFMTQIALEFDGELKYKSIDFLQGENNPPGCVWAAPNAALANINKELLPSIIATESMEFEDITDLFILTFAGDAGDSVTVSVDSDKITESFCAVDNLFSYVYAADEDVRTTAVASASANEGIPAVVKLEMDVVDDFATASGEDYADSLIYLTITNEENGSTLKTAINNIPIRQGGHRDGGPSVPTFIVENTVISGNEFTVEISGVGYLTYRIENYDFSSDLELTNADFVPGDVNMDGEVDETDALIYATIMAGENAGCGDLDGDGVVEDELIMEEKDGVEVATVGDDFAILEDILDGKYNANADFNRDGSVTEEDNVFGELPEIGNDKEDDDEDDSSDEPKKTAPKRMSKPDLTAGIGSFTVQWTAPKDGGSEITGYIIKYGVKEDRLIKEVEIEGNTSKKKVIKDLSEDQKYYVQIAAVNEIGTGEFSPVASVTTKEESGGGGGGGGGGGFGGGGGSAIGGSPSPSTPSKPSANEPFTDLGNHSWAKDSIYTLKNKGIISGISATEFAPANNIKRGDFILILARMMSIDDDFSENFDDVPSNMYYYNAIGSARAAGIAKGSGNSFMPENTITRQDLITLAYRAFLAQGYIEETDDLSALDEFGDKGMISDYAQTAMASMVSAGIIKGSDGNVNPLGNATRAEVAVMCARLLALMD